MKCYVICESATGNTKKVADVIYETLKDQQNEVRIMTIDEAERVDKPNLYFIGFPIKKGTCPPNVSDFLRTLHNQNIAIFGTVGLGGSEVYYQHIHQKVMKSIAKDNEVDGYFYCQGKMPTSVRDKYEAIARIYPQHEPTQTMLENFDKALSHPDETDLIHAKEFALRMVKKTKKVYE